MAHVETKLLEEKCIEDVQKLLPAQADPQMHIAEVLKSI